MTYRPKPSASV